MPVDTTGDPEDVALPTGEVEAYEVWAGAYWARSPSHLLVEGPRPTLYDCFNHADLLISDISSVVPDFVASGKPYVVTNPAGEPHEQIRATYASTTAAYLADPDPATWEPMLELVETVDPMAGRRAQLREDLLGPRLAHPVDRWNHAVDDLIRRARAAVAARRDRERGRRARVSGVRRARRPAPPGREPAPPLRAAATTPTAPPPPPARRPRR